MASTTSPVPAALASPEVAPFGSWVSPVTSEVIVGQTIQFGQTAVAGDTVYWTEGRPQEQGRNVIVACRAAETALDLMPAPFNARSRVHEYGGGAFCIGRGELFFANFSDQRLYRVGLDRHDAVPQALTDQAAMRYADFVADPARPRLVGVREDHGGAPAEAVTTLVAVSLVDGAETVLASGHDFFAHARFSPDGRRLAWLSWDHPNMPWDGNDLWLAEVQADGSLGPAQHVAGGAEESIYQPSWSRDGVLHFVSDCSGWWNLYRWQPDAAGGTAQALLPMEADFGTPQWQFDFSHYGFDAQGRILAHCGSDGGAQLLLITPGAGAAASRVEAIATPYRVIRELRVGDGFAAFIGGSPTAPEAVVRLDLDSLEQRVLRSASQVVPDPAFVSVAEAITFPTEGGEQAHALFYAPVSGHFRGAEGERPPLVVMAHGGPTSACTAAFKWGIQFWTSRGFAVVDVNYGGSSGYGRAYRQRLNGQWGVVDVDDVVNAARFLVARGSVHAERIAIRGGSAGGYTTLCALTFRDYFKAGASLYGIGDLEALARDTHKFESRYLDRLIGAYPEQAALYRARSPVHHTDRLSSAMILLQGAEDKAVPPSQAEAMFEAVRAKGLPVAYLLFQNEQHGFRRAETIKRAIEAELYFYGRVFGFTPADAIEPVQIHNLPPV